MKFVICSILIILVLAQYIEAKKSAFVNKNKKKQQSMVVDLAAQAQALIDKKAEPLNIVKDSEVVAESDKQELVSNLEEQSEKLETISVKKSDVLTFEGELQNLQFTGEQLLKMLKFNDKFMEICGENLEKCDFQSESSDEDKDEDKPKKKNSSFLQIPQISREQLRQNALQNIINMKKQLNKNNISFMQLSKHDKINDQNGSQKMKQFKAMKQRQAMRAQLKAKALPQKQNQRYAKPDKTYAQIVDDMKFAQIDNHIPKWEQRMAKKQTIESKIQGKLTNNQSVINLFKRDYNLNLSGIQRFRQVAKNDIVLQNPRFNQKHHMSKSAMEHEAEIYAKLPSISQTLKNGGFKNQAQKVHYFLGDQSMRFKSKNYGDVSLEEKLLANRDVLLQAEKDEHLESYADDIKEEAAIERYLNLEQ